MSQVVEGSPLQAGREAAARHAWHEAFDLFTLADQETPLSADDLAAMADASWWIGRLDEAMATKERAFSAYMEEGQPRRAATIAFSLTMDYFGKLQPSVAMGWFGRGERLLQNEPECVEHGWLQMMKADFALDEGDPDKGLEFADKTLDIGTRFGDRDLQAFGLLMQGRALVARGEVRDGLALLDEATVAAVSGELRPQTAGFIYCMAISSTSALGDYGRAGDWNDAAKRWCERQSITGFPGICRVHRAEIMRLRGSWTEAEQETRRALNELSNFNLHIASEGFYELGEIRMRMGDLPDAEEAFRQAHELGRDPNPGLAMLRLAQDNTAAASQSIKRALEEPTLGPLQRMKLLPAQVTIALGAGDIDRARTAVQELEEIAGKFGSPPLRAAALCARGELALAEGDTPAAVLDLKAAWRLWKQQDLPYEEAKTRTALGVALRADGDEGGAELELNAARSVFDRLGAVLDLRRVMDLLGEEIGEGVPKAAAPTARATKTFMFTDIVSSTTLVEALGDDAWQNLLGWHDETLRQLFMANCGEEIKQVGDGFFVAFDTPSEAVECAVGIQRRLAEHRKQHGFAPQVRIGLHRTEATRKGNDYSGKGVHEAARIGALAQGGEILASKDVIEGGSVRFPVSPLRRVELKGVSEPVEVGSIEPF